jgi:ArsR family transcriptional regulator
METLFKALADATRLRILGLLLAGEVCVCDIHESLKIPQSRASRHLAYLRRAGLVETRREGLWIHYRLGNQTDPVLAAITEAVRHALTHIDTVHRDGQRLHKRTGCCVPAPGDLASASCCGPQPALGIAGQ